MAETFTVTYGFMRADGFTHLEQRVTRRGATATVEQHASKESLGPTFSGVRVELCEMMGDPIEMHFDFDRDPGSETSRNQITKMVTDFVHALVTGGAAIEMPKSAIIRPVAKFLPRVLPKHSPAWMTGEHAEEAIIAYASRRTLGAAFVHVEILHEVEAVFQFRNYNAEENAERVDYLAALIADWLARDD